MKQIRSVAHSRHVAPEFVMLFGLELMQLRKLNDFAFRLLIELLACADFTTGRVSTTHARLIGVLDFDRVPGAHALPRATPGRINRALDELLSLRLISDLDRAENEKAKGLFFRVPGRMYFRASNAMSVGRSVGPKKGGKRATARVSGSQAPEERGTERKGVQERDLSPYPLPSPQPPTAAPEHIGDKLKAVRKSIADRRGAG